MKYLEPKDFNIKFPLGQLIGSGGQAYLYESSIYAIKVFFLASEFITEINTYSRLDHPCIIKPLNWTFDGKGLLALPLGIDLMKAYTNKLITLEEIISDTYSALMYMHTQNLCHNDITTTNIVYLNNRATLIDMGASSPYKQENRSGEMYLIALTYYTIATGNKEFIADRKTGNIYLDDFIQKVRYFEESQEIPLQLIVRKYTGIEVPKKKFQQYELRKEIQQLGQEFKIEDVSLANSLFCECLLHSESEVELLSRACIILANIVSDTTYIDKSIRDGYSALDINQMMIDIIFVTELIF